MNFWGRVWSDPTKRELRDALAARDLLQEQLDEARKALVDIGALVGAHHGDPETNPYVCKVVVQQVRTMVEAKAHLHHQLNTIQDVLNEPFQRKHTVDNDPIVEMCNVLDKDNR